MADERVLVVPGALDGSRVDKTVAVLLGLSRAQARDLVERGVTLEGRRVGPGERVAAGALIVAPSPVTETPLAPEPVSFGVLYEDEDLLVVDKPSGVVVHPGVGRSGGTLVAGLLHRYPELEGVGEKGRWGLVHRLDKDTSGALLVARNDASYRTLVSDLRRRHVGRVYLALVHGVPGSASGTIEAPIGRDPRRPMRKTLSHDGKPALTHYEVVEAYPRSDVMLLRVTLDTGRSHQVRVHLSAIGHPVVGDVVYGGRPRRTRTQRMFLHAHEITFTHPRSGVVVTVTSPLPPELESILHDLG